MECKNIVNFTKLPVSMEVKAENFQEKDISKVLGNIVFSTQSSIEAFRLANKIYDSEEAEYSPEEIELLTSIVKESNISLPYRRAIFEAFGKEL